MRDISIHRLAGLLAIVALACGGMSAAAQPQNLRIVSQGPVAEQSTRRFVLHSAQLDQDVTVDVTEPRTPPAAGTRLPAVYALDEGYGVAGPVVSLLGGANGMAPAFVVAIGYQPGPGVRTRNLLHNPSADPQGSGGAGGGGAAFERFLLDELRPFIESRFAVDRSSSILFGHSLGGVFTANLLARHPDAFGGYVIASPSVWADPGLPARVAAAVRMGGGRRVFVAVGGAEAERMREGQKRIAAALRGRGSTFVVRSQVFADGNHLSYYPALVTTALPWLLPPSSADL